MQRLSYFQIININVLCWFLLVSFFETIQFICNGNNQSRTIGLRARFKRVVFVKGLKGEFFKQIINKLKDSDLYLCNKKG